MLRKSKVLAASLVATAAFVASAVPASAQGPPNTQEGLVNVAVEDVIVQAPISLAANICDVNVAVLAEVADEAAACEATADSAATARPNSNGPPTQQSGLVNVLLDDILVQVPISVAANVCDVNVAVLAQLDDTAEACNATAESVASPGNGTGGPGNGGAGGGIIIDIPIDIDIGNVLNNDTSSDGEAGTDLVTSNTADGTVADPTTVLDSATGDLLGGLGLTLLQ